MSSTWVLKLPQVDKPQQPILVHVTQKNGADLDLDLLATDGEEAYKGKVRQRNLAKLQSKNFEGTDVEWSDLLKYALVSKRNSNVPEEQTNNLEIDGVISGKASKRILSITLRNRIEDITHKLGAVDLSFSDNTDDVDLFGWACQLAGQRDQLEEEAVSSSKSSASTKETITNFQTQLQDLIKAKQEHEEQLLTKFAALLNEKKLKIREQQHVLQTAKVDPKKLEEVRRASGKARSEARTSNKRKRGSGNSKDQSATVEEESDGYEAMDIDQESGDEEQNLDGVESRQDTPSRSASPESVTASEDEQDEVVPAKKPILAKAKGVAHQESPPPPPRSLPFQKKGQNAKAKQNYEPKSQGPSIMDEDADTESEDDEL